MSFPLLKPPHPVTYAYVGTCAGITGGVIRAAYASLPRGWRPGKNTLPLIALCLGGAYGLAVWLGGLDHAWHHVHARWGPTARDILSIAVGYGGLFGVAGATTGLFFSGVLDRDVSPADLLERFAGIGIVTSIMVYALVPGLHF
jgi:hypothetical protein